MDLRSQETSGSPEPDGALTSLRAELEAVDRVPIHERVALFDRANATIARELAELDEV